MVDFVTGAPVPGDLDVRWIHGAAGEPPIQVHRYEDHTFVLRQSKAVHYEAPFVFLLFGNDRALLLDTGATADPARYPLRTTVDRLVEQWLATHPRDGYELVVAHTHGHGDHVAGDAQFADRPHTTLVKSTPDEVQAYFGFTDWPERDVGFDLGGRVLELLPIPGHHVSSIATYDPWTGLLLTGDSVYPGRLYGRDMPTFVASAERLATWAAERPVTHVLGCHIEMTRRPRRDYPLGSRFQPDEPPLQMSPDRLGAVRDASRAVADRPGVHTFDDFIIFNGPCTGAIFRHAGRLLLSRLRRH